MRTVEQGPDYFERQFPKETFPLYGWETDHQVCQPRSGRPKLPIAMGSKEDCRSLLSKASGSTKFCAGLLGILGLFGKRSFLFTVVPIWMRYRKRNGASKAVIRSNQRPDPRLDQRCKTDPISGVRESGLLASISDYHVFHKFTPGGRKSPASIYLDAVQMALENGIRPRLHLEDATRASIDFILYFVDAVRKKSADFPETVRPKFRLCDTLGLGLPDEDVRSREVYQGSS